MPPQDFTQSPEFRAAVKAAANEAVQGLAAQLHAAREEAGTAPQDGDRALINELVVALAQLTDQGVGKYQRKTDPAILSQRQEARERMTKLILEAHAKGEMPVYALRHKVFLPMGGVGEQLVEPMYIGTDKQSYQRVISWPGVPNEAMTPGNEVAEGIYAAFKGSIGSEKTGAPDPLSKVLAISPNGTVLEGEAAAMVLRQGPAGRDKERVDRIDEAQKGNYPVGGIVGSPQQKIVRVLGSIHPGAMENSNNVSIIRR